jgi:hypothetical protein
VHGQNYARNGGQQHLHANPGYYAGGGNNHGGWPYQHQ